MHFSNEISRCVFGCHTFEVDELWIRNSHDRRSILKTYPSVPHFSISMSRRGKKQGIIFLP